MNLQKILKSRRGVALENALLFMLVIFSLCALLTSLTLIGHFQTRINKLTLENEIALEQIGEDFLASVKAGENFEKSYENYVYSKDVNGNLYALSVAASSNPQQVLLYIQVERTPQGTVHVLQWRYSFPQ
jgi:hypothetical protein